jgi:hypothetical protein
MKPLTLEDKLRLAREAGITFPHYTNTDNPIDFPQIQAGGDINAGDGGYSIGTEEAYKEFVKNRNKE